MHKIASLATYNFKFFRGTFPQTSLDWLAPSGELGLPLIYACYAVLDVSVKAPIKRLHHSSFIDH